jgi:tetratricopeptide (TPR) repeat protein
LLTDGLDHFYNLEYDYAISAFEALRDDAPANAAWQNHVAMSYLYKQLLLAGALEGDLFGASNRFFRTKKIQPDPQLDARFRTANTTAQQLCERSLKENSRDTEALYACGVAHAQRATYQGLVERSAMSFLGSARKANAYHSRLARLAPRRYDAYLIPGLYDFVLGSLPGAVKVLFFFVGLNGDKERGIRMVENVAEWGDGARHDARILITVMYRREKRFADAQRALRQLSEAFPRNYIFQMEAGSIYRAADQLPQAIREYELALERVRAGVPNYPQAPVARIHFELGELYRRTGDTTSARQHLAQVAGTRGSTPELTKAAQDLINSLPPAPATASQ